MLVIEPEIRSLETFSRLAPDLAGWRRSTTGWPDLDATPVSLIPDWVAEIVSQGHEKHDLVTKPRTLLTAEVPHYWVLDPEEQTLLVHRWSRDGYVIVLRATAGETVRAEPFEAIELDVTRLLGLDED